MRGLTDAQRETAEALCRAETSWKHHDQTDAFPCSTCIRYGRIVAAREAAAKQRIIAVLPDECWVTRNDSVSCITLVGITFVGGVWTEEMCCLPCRVRAALAHPTDEATP